MQDCKVATFLVCQEVVWAYFSPDFLSFRYVYPVFHKENRSISSEMACFPCFCGFFLLPLMEISLDRFHSF